MATLKDTVPALLSYIKAHTLYLENNYKILDIYNGNLLPVVDQALARAFSPKYYEQIKDRIIAINVLKRISDKSARAYVTNPQRVTDEKYKENVALYEDMLYLNCKMQSADVYANLFKGYALELFLHMGYPKLRVLPYDRFLPYSDDQVDGTHMTAFIKFMGKRQRVRGDTYAMLEVYHIYTADEFIAVDSEGDTVQEDMVTSEGINPYGVIPFIYGNRGNDMLLPTQDTDTMSLTKMIPLLLTDLGGAIMFQCFSIVYGINVDSKNLTMSPNSFWDLKSDLASTGNGAPSVGTIKPEADVDKVLHFIMTTFTFWLETRGIRVGSTGTVDAQNAASGISKIIDEMDATELIQKSQEGFRKDEADFWQLLKVMNNYWVMNRMITHGVVPTVFGDDFAVTTQFDAPEPMTDRATEVNTVKIERDAGFISTRQAIIQLYPDLTPEQVDEQLAEIDQESGAVMQAPPPANPIDQNVQQAGGA